MTKFKKGKSYKTEGGWEAMLLLKDEQGDLIFWHYLINDYLYHRVDGSNISNDEKCNVTTEEWAEPRKGTVWVNVYKEGVGCGFVSRKDADSAKSLGLLRLACVRVDWVEGQGL